MHFYKESFFGWGYQKCKSSILIQTTAKIVTNISKLSTRHFFLKIRHQHRSSLKSFSKTHDACYSMESAKRTAGNRHRCNNLLGHNLLMGCKYIINSKGLTLDQCLRKAHMMTVFCKSFCFLGFKNDGKRCKIIN